MKVALGSDFGTFPLAQSNATEFAELVNNGLSIPRALRAGTSVAAELLMRDDIGILAVGKGADIIAMPGDPFDDITVTERVEFVMKGGRSEVNNDSLFKKPWILAGNRARSLRPSAPHGEGGIRTRGPAFDRTRL